MKKNQIDCTSVWFKRTFKTLLTKKFIYLLVSGLVLLAGVTEKSYAQSAKMTFELRNSTVRDVLEHIERNSDFTFMFENNTVDVDAKVDFSAEDESIDIILDRLLDRKSVV